MWQCSACFRRVNSPIASPGTVPMGIHADRYGKILEPLKNYAPRARAPGFRPGRWGLRARFGVLAASGTETPRLPSSELGAFAEQIKLEQGFRCRDVGPAHCLLSLIESIPFSVVGSSNFHQLGAYIVLCWRFRVPALDYRLNTPFPL